MRSLILAGFLLSGTILTSAAQADPDIFISGSAGRSVFDWLYGEDTAFTAQGAASIEYSFTPTLGAQGDVVVRRDFYDLDGPYSLTETDADAALHLFYREQDRFLVGAIGQVGRFTSEFEDLVGSNIFQVNRGYLGLEGQVYFDQVTLYGQLGVHQPEPVDYYGMAFEGVFATAEIRYFLTPDLKLEAHAGALTYEDPNVDYTAGMAYYLGASIEYRFEDSPISAFAGYDFAHTELEGGHNLVDEHRFLIGVKLNHGTDTLLDRDRTGISLKPVKPVRLLYGVLG